MLYGWLVLLHVLAALIWTGGHIVLSAVVLPRVLRERSVEQLLAFESRYERIGIPALIVQVASGVYLAWMQRPDLAGWFADDRVAHLLQLKLGLLLATVLFALDARLRLIPRLTAERLPAMAWHIIPVTLIAVAFVVVGVSFRYGMVF